MTHVTCRLTAKNGISSGTLRSVIECGLPLPLPFSVAEGAPARQHVVPP